MAAAKWWQLAPAWGVALVMSGLLVWAGRHWPTPLLAQAWAHERPDLAVVLALALVLLPPLGMAFWLALQLARHRDSGESIDRAHGER